MRDELDKVFRAEKRVPALQRLPDNFKIEFRALRDAMKDQVPKGSLPLDNGPTDLRKIEALHEDFHLNRMRKIIYLALLAAMKENPDQDLGANLSESEKVLFLDFVIKMKAHLKEELE